MLLAIILSVLLSLSSLVLGVSVLSRNQKSSTNVIFFIICVIAAIWSVLFESTFYIFLSKPTITSQHALGILNKASFISGLLFVLAVLCFTYYFPKRRQLRNFVIYLVPSLIVVILSTTKPIAGIISIIDGKYQISSGKFIWVYILALAGGVLLIMYNLFSQQRLLSDNQKAQNKLLATGFGLGIVVATLLAVGSPIIFPNLTIDILSPVAVLFFLLPVTAAIRSYKLFDLRIVVARSSAYIFSVAVIVALYSLVVFGFARSIFDVSLTTVQAIFFAVFSAITALAFQPIKKFFDKFSNRIFYKDAYDGQELLNSVNTSLVSSQDLYKLLCDTAEVIKSKVKVEFCTFYIDEKASIDFHLAGTSTKMFAEAGWAELIASVRQQQHKIIGIDTGIPEEDLARMRDLHIECILKMTSQDLDVGYVIVGQKRSGSVFSGQDTQVLEIIADEVAIAVQNALRFEEIAQFNVTLQKKIEVATSELQKSNEKLKALDEAKDEFISMASHQLRTPLTSVKGYISMLLEGDAGELNEQQQNFLKQTFLSSQRMVYLIADLLNVSRLKTGKFVIETKPTYLPSVVESEIEQLHETVKARGLEMVFDKPSTFPVMELDETKTRQVIMNFADNAVYYTPKGGLITIKLTATPESVEYTVTDTGIGVPKADQHKLFTKFYRASNARKARPDGTGLGLFMAKKVIAAQGGAIIFKTIEGKGSTFGFSFPREKLEVTVDTLATNG